MRILMQYKGKKEEVKISLPWLKEQYVVTLKEPVSMDESDAKWFLQTEPKMFQVVKEAGEGNGIFTVKQEQEEEKEDPVDDNPWLNPAENTEELESILEDDTEKSELTGDGDEGDGNLSEPEELEDVTVVGKTPHELYKMNVDELKEYANSLGIEINETADKRKQRTAYLKSLKALG